MPLASRVEIDNHFRFWLKVDFNGPIPVERPDLGPCWIWTGRLTKSGYGRFDISTDESIFAPRFAYELMRGLIPKTLMPDHLCRVRACIRPWHLEVVTARENILRGTNQVASLALATHCIHGHEFSGSNLRIQIRDDGRRRRCRKCDRYHDRGLKMLKRLGLLRAASECGNSNQKEIK